MYALIWIRIYLKALDQIGISILEKTSFPNPLSAKSLDTELQEGSSDLKH